MVFYVACNNTYRDVLFTIMGSHSVQATGWNHINTGIKTHESLVLF